MKVCLVKVAPIADDPRVRKQGDALAAAGHEVWALGTTGGRSPRPGWPVVDVPAPSRSPSAKASAAARLLALGRVPAAASMLYWSFPENRALLAAAKERRADLYVANDWRTLPVAATAAAATGAAFAYDSHELGVEEFLERRLWRLLFPAWVRSIEARSIRAAAFVSTVSEGIADILQSAYRLPSRPLVIRNLPPYTECAFRPTGDVVEVLYQGMFISNRGLEPLVESVPLWRPGLRLTLRGVGKPAYERHLRSLVAASPAADRITIAPPVAMVDLVPAAARADVGIHPLLVTSNQMRYSLPNKLFEYLMAGLAVCVTGIPEMAEVVDRHQVGVTIDEPTPAGIAAAVNRLDRATIDRGKQRALVAARELCWEREQERFVNAVSSVTAKSGSAAAR